MLFFYVFRLLYKKIFQKVVSMNVRVLVSIVLLLFTTKVFAERILGTTGVISDFAKIEEIMRNKKITREYRQKTLEKNLLTAVKFSLIKKYPDYEDRIKDLSFDKVKFEQLKGTYKYYISFKEYYFYYDFATDPELYVQMPLDDRIYIKTPEIEEEMKSISETGGKASTGGTDNPNKPLMTKP